jgi:hypothetical protein
MGYMASDLLISALIMFYDLIQPIILQSNYLFSFKK